MSRLLYFDCASGASGDMILGALVDLGLSMDALRAELAKLPLGGYRLEARRVRRSGIMATKVDVIVEEAAGHPAEGGHGHHHAHRGLRQILGLLEGSSLTGPVKERAASLFRRLAEVEASVHGTTPDEVHFHEVGAVDSIVDVVGAVIGLGWLDAERVVASPLNVGAGTVSMSHGVVGVPPPATARLVEGVPVYGGGDGELLTPTGALVITAYATAYGPLPVVRPTAVGYGAGTKEAPGRPNVLRLIVGDEEVAGGEEHIVVLEATIDDMSPQLCAPLVDRLLAAGALDVYFTSVYMKKTRPGLLVTVLVRPEGRENAEEILFAETTTLGVRRREWIRTVLERDVVPVATPYGSIGVKIGRRGRRVYNAQPEFADCERAASTHGVPVKEVWAAALASYRTSGSSERP